MSDDIAFLTFDDLVELRIVHNRQDLSIKQRNWGFPRPIRLGAQGRHGRALFERRAVQAWIRQQVDRAKA
jgi:hypothetical protein